MKGHVLKNKRGKNVCIPVDCTIDHNENEDVNEE